MAEAFTAGVKMGGLTDDTEIRILLCYLTKTAGPVSREILEGALLEEQLVNYFEFSGALAELKRQKLIEEGEKGYTATAKGATVADALGYDLPRSVRESAISAVIRLQRWVHRAEENRAEVVRGEDGWRVICSIQEEGQPDTFRLELAKESGADYVISPTPDKPAIEQIREIWGTAEYPYHYGADSKACNVDIAVDCTGTPDIVPDCFHIVRKGGKITLVASYTNINT